MSSFKLNSKQSLTESEISINFQYNSDNVRMIQIHLEDINDRIDLIATTFLDKDCFYFF